MDTYVILRGPDPAAALVEHVGADPAIREHAKRADLPVDEIVPVVDTVLVRPDPEPAPA